MVRSLHPFLALLGEGYLQVTKVKATLLYSALLLPVFAPPYSPPLPWTPHGTYSAASSREQHLRTLGSSNCAGSARWAHQESNSGCSNSKSHGPLTQSSYFISLLRYSPGAFQNVPIRCPAPHYLLRNREQFLIMCP